MSRVAYVNGRYLPFREAKVHVEDRGYQFADGVYEVCQVRGGRLIDERRHIERLQRSLGELRIPMPMSVEALGVVLRGVVTRNCIGYGLVYLQISRGVARRDHAFPSPAVAPSIVVTARPLEHETQREARRHAASRSSACRTTAGAASTSRPSACCPMSWRGRRPSSRARAMPGSSTKTVSSWKRLGQCLDRHGKGRWSPGTPITPSCAASRVRWCSTRSRRRVFRSRTRLHAAGGLCGARGLHHLGDPARAAGGEDRRPDHRRRQAGPGRAALRASSPLCEDRIRQAQQHARPRKH